MRQQGSLRYTEYLRSRSKRRQTEKTHLVLMLLLWQLERLFEDAILLYELDSLLPLIEVACDEDFAGGVFPVKCGERSLLPRLYDYIPRKRIASHLP